MAIKITERKNPVTLYIAGYASQEGAQAASWCTRLFGGCTVLMGEGHWQGDVYYKEPCVVIRAFPPAGMAMEYIKQRIQAYMIGYGERTKQKQVCFELNNTLSMIDIPQQDQI